MNSPGKKIIMVGRWRAESANGVDRTIVHLTRELLALGHEVTLWTPSRKFKKIQETKAEENLPQYELPVRMAGLALPRATRDFVREHSARYSLAHFHCVFTPANNSIAAQLQCPYTTTPNGAYSPAAFNLRTALKKRIFLLVSERRYLENAAFIHALSDQERKDIGLICRQKHFVVAPNGISMNELGPAQSDNAGIGSGPTRTMLFLGRLAVHHKGLDRMLKAFAEAQVPYARLILAGPDFRGGEGWLRKRAKQLKVADQVIFTGPKYGDDKWKLLSEADIFVHTSRWEGIPFSVLEAMALKRPVLVSPGTNLADYVREHEAGWTTTDTDFVTAMKECLAASADELQARGRNSRTLVEKVFQWPEIARKVAAGYQNHCS